MSDHRPARDGRAHERFKDFAEIPLLFAALALIPILAAPFIFDLSASVRSGLAVAAWAIWALFVVEYLVLLYLAPSRWRMIRTHVLDLLIIVLPFLRPLRAARSARLLRLATVSGRIAVAFRAVTGRRGSRAFFAGVLLVVAVSGLLVYAFERHHEESTLTDLGDSLWWALVTATTVGYGDHAPVSAEGRGVAVVLMLVGIGMLGVVTANIAAFFVQSDDDAANTELHERLDRIEMLLARLDPDQAAAVIAEAASPAGDGASARTDPVDT